MRVATIAFILAAGAIAVLGLSDALSPLGISNLSGGPLVLLICIPISLALFSFLSHQQHERLKAQERKEQKVSSYKD